MANICVYASPDRIKPIAIIVPAEPALLKLAKDNGVTAEGMELYHSRKMQGVLLEELQARGRAGGLANMEMIDHVIISEEEWTPQNVRSLKDFAGRGLMACRILSRLRRSFNGGGSWRNIRRRLTRRSRVAKSLVEIDGAA